MSSKTIVLILATFVISAALIFDGVSHRHNVASKDSNQATSAASGAASPPSPDPSPANADGAPPPDSATSVDASGDPGPADAAQAQSGGNATDGSVQADGNVPVEDSSQSADAAQPQDNATQSQNYAPKPPAIIVPAGTTLTVRLGEDLGSRISEENQRFSATLDRDVIVHGRTVIAAGSSITGRVVSAKPAGAVAGEANLQLKITSVHLDNGNLKLVSSIRSFGPPLKGKNKVGKFVKGLFKRASGEEKEVVLAENSSCSFTLEKNLRIQ
jgi:hypothetical protein